MKSRTNIWSRDLKGSDDLEVHSEIAIFFTNINDKKKGATVCAGFNWLKIESSGVLRGPQKPKILGQLSSYKLL
jgi:hypothetical protein